MFSSVRHCAILIQSRSVCTLTNHNTVSEVKSSKCMEGNFLDRFGGYSINREISRFMVPKVLISASQEPDIAPL